MTTVGYGDRTPKRIVSRLIAVLWILIGVTLFSTFTAALTGEISSASTPPRHHIAALNIGVLKGRTYEASVVLRKGGYVEVTADGSLISGIDELIEKLRNGSIHGFMLDKFAYVKALAFFTNTTRGTSSYSIDNARFFLNGVHHLESTRGGESFSYGVLIKEMQDYEYFRQFIADNQHNLQNCKELHMSEVPDDQESSTHDIFSPKSGVFGLALGITTGIIVVIMVVGVVYEIIRRKWYRIFCNDNVL